MKILLPFALAVMLLQGCSSCNHEKPAQQEGTSDSLDIAPKDTTAATHTDIRKERGRLIAKPFPYSGIWVNNHYLEMLNKTKSLRKSQSAVDMSYIKLPPNSNEQAEVIWNFHEGSPYAISIQDNQWFLADATDRNKVYFPIVLSKDSQSLTIKDQAFTKITSFNGYPLIAETVLFGGIWQGENIQVRFLTDGSIMGWDGYDHYKVEYDYIDEGRNLDILVLTTSEGKKEEVSYIMRGKMLEIYALDCEVMEPGSTDCAVHKLGKKIVTLKKVQDS